MVLPGLVGSGSLWLRGCHQVEAVYDSGEWLALQGEPGVGKLAVLRAVHQRRNPAGRFHVLDAADAADQDWPATVRRELLDGTGALVIRHVDRLNARRLHALSAALQETKAAERADAAVGRGHPGPRRREPRTWPSCCGSSPAPSSCRRSGITSRTCTTSCRSCSRSSTTTPRLVCSPEAMQMLLRSSWPGNTEQLWQVLRRVVQHRRTGTIQPDDLPPECWTVSRRLLSPLESMERDAIVQSLQDHKGNKVKAAESLGHVPGDDLPQDPRIRHSHPVRLIFSAVLALVRRGSAQTENRCARAPVVRRSCRAARAVGLRALPTRGAAMTALDATADESPQPPAEEAARPGGRDRATGGRPGHAGPADLHRGLRSARSGAGRRRAGRRPGRPGGDHPGRHGSWACSWPRSGAWPSARAPWRASSASSAPSG